MQTTLLIPTKARVLIILQLCVGLSFMLWLVGYPFMGGHFAYQSDLLLFEAVMGKNELFKKLDPAKAAVSEDRTQLNAVFFQQLDRLSQEKIIKEAERRQIALTQPPSLKLRDALKFAFELPPLLLAWTMLSVIIPIALLLRHPWALPATLLIPLVTLGYASTNWYSGINPLQYSDQTLFPNEQTLALHQPIQGSLDEQKEQLKKGWEAFLVKHFTNEVPSANPELFQKQVAKGEFRFNFERLKRLPPSLSYPFWEQRSPYVLLLYLLWNCLFAWMVVKHVRIETFQNSDI